MIASYFLIILSAASSILLVTGVRPYGECVGIPGKTFTIVLENKMNKSSGEWETTFDAYQDHPNDSDAARLELKHAVVDCDGRKVLHLSGVFRGPPSVELSPTLRFHERCGTNVAITNKGRTIQKLNGDDKTNAVTFTNRPLKTNELFEVRVDKKVNKHGHFMGIGVTTLSPDRDPVPSHMNRAGAWMFYHKQVYTNAQLTVKENVYNLDTTQVGDRIGVMRSETGTLHLFHNGIDKGPGSSNVPMDVYGTFELYGDLAQVTII